MSLIYIVLGVFLGLSSGFFGIGGSLIATPILKMFFKVHDLIAIASPLPVIVPTALGGVMGYWQKKTINKKIAAATIIGGLPATIAGAFMTKIISSNWLMMLTGLFVVFSGVRLLYGKTLNEMTFSGNISIKAAVIGFISGIFSGLLAIGGGIVLVPAYVIILGLTMHEAISTSLLCIAVFAIPGTIVHSYLNHIDWQIAINLSLGIIPAGYLGAKAGSAMNAQKLKTAFSIFLIIFGVYFILNQINLI